MRMCGPSRLLSSLDAVGVNLTPSGKILPIHEDTWCLFGYKPLCIRNCREIPETKRFVSGNVTTIPEAKRLESHNNNRDFKKVVLLRRLAIVVGVDFALDLFRKAL
jgi:hypothetical protein